MVTRGLALLLLVLGLCTTAAGATGSACLDSAKTELEALYCKVVSEGQGAGLPSLTDFKRNDPAVQALLLRRPAARLGLDVPEIDGTSLTPAPAQAKPEPAAEQPAERPDPARQLSGCRLEGQRITCPQRHFELATNQPNSNLAKGVLGPDNRLGLTPFAGNRSDQEAVRRYLSGAYDRYIPKMVEIGLGANTMSFTAFYHAFHTTEDAGIDFARRMEQTFTLLKQDKKTLAVKARYHDNLPQDLSLCEVINADIIVCDDVGTNWVFVAPSR